METLRSDIKKSAFNPDERAELEEFLEMWRKVSITINGVSWLGKTLKNIALWALAMFALYKMYLELK